MLDHMSAEHGSRRIGHYRSSGPVFYDWYQNWRTIATIESLRYLVVYIHPEWWLEKALAECEDEVLQGIRAVTRPSTFLLVAMCPALTKNWGLWTGLPCQVVRRTDDDRAEGATLAELLARQTAAGTSARIEA